MDLRISPAAFFQTNTEMAERLLAVATDYAGRFEGSERLYDLYCGIGTIGLAMARHAGEVWGIETVPEAIADAGENARRNGIANAYFMAGDARTRFARSSSAPGRPTSSSSTPRWRAGLSKKVVRRAIERDAKRIVYVSCNPTTLAPNAAQLVEAGYRLRRVRPVDMFPQPRTSSAWPFWRSIEHQGFRRSGGPRPVRRGAAARGAARCSATRPCGPTTPRWGAAFETIVQPGRRRPRHRFRRRRAGARPPHARGDRGEDPRPRPSARTALDRRRGGFRSGC